MNLTELNELKEALKKGIILKEYTVENRPAARLGFKWIPIINLEGKSIGWEEIVDETYKPLDGTYTNPIFFIEGMNVYKGLWYTDGNNIWEALKEGIPTDFNDVNYFDIIA